MTLQALTATIHPSQRITQGDAMQGQVKAKVVLKLKEVRRPISDDTIGYRIQAAIPNQAARKMKPRKDKKTGDVHFVATGETTTSFSKQYLIAESSDMTNELNEQVFQRLRDNLRWMGYSHFEWVSDEEKKLHPL